VYNLSGSKNRKEAAMRTRLNFARQNLGWLVLLVFILLASVPTSAQAQELKVPDWIYAHCSRYFTMEVSSAGTAIIFWRQDDPTKVCAVVTNARGPSGQFLEAMQLHLFSFDCWQANLAYEAVVTGSNSGFVIVVECDKGERRVRVTLGYQDGVLFGYVNEW